MAEQIALWLGVLLTATGLVVAVVRYVVYPVARRARGVVVRRQQRVVARVVQPIMDEHQERMEIRLKSISINQAETSRAIGRVVTRVDKLERTVNGLPGDVAEMKLEQARIGGRIDDIYRHLIGGD